MKKHYYNDAMLIAELRSYEQQHGVSTAELVAAYQSGSLPAGPSVASTRSSGAATSAELARLTEHREPQPA